MPVALIGLESRAFPSMKRCVPDWMQRTDCKCQVSLSLSLQVLQQWLQVPLVAVPWLQSALLVVLGPQRFWSNPHQCLWHDWALPRCRWIPKRSAGTPC